MLAPAERVGRPRRLDGSTFEVARRRKVGRIEVDNPSIDAAHACEAEQRKTREPATNPEPGLFEVSLSENDQ